ncbi:gamma-glutamyltransferase [Streptomyces sp. NPDC055692]|uniref:gamma-glutamyltransferase family protein n=1 Tax=Streptomyces sp. NPDC055692 TaxID=3155683 RepID=UPI00341D7B05
MVESQTYASAGARGATPRRSPVLSAGGMAASAHPSVTFAGAAVLAGGGNAVDAALAMAAQSWIALPGQCGVGGDAFAVVREPDGRVWTVCGSGYGPDGGDHTFYTDRGLSAVPVTGPLSVAVPGTPAALAALHATGGSWALSRLWERAARAAEAGLPCTAKTQRDIADTAAALRQDAEAARALLPGDRLPDVGQRLPQPDLARTIRELAADPAGFYTGAFAERAVAALKGAGAPFSGEEWALCGDVAPQPAVTGSYAGRTVHQTPPPSPGWMAVQQAALCDGRLGGMEWLGAEAVHLLASAARLSFAERVERCGSDSDTWRESLTPEAIAVARKRIALGDIPRGYARAADGDTTSMVAVDAEGRAVSFIHSLAFTFGSKTTVPGTGVLLNNRLGRGAYLVPGHPNGVQPRRRPLHTLNAWLVTNAAGELEHVGNTPGGDGQVQWNTQLLSHLLDHGLDPQTAVDAPRFTVHPGSDADVLDQPDELRCENRLGGGVLEALRARGHAVRETGAWDAGGSGMVVSVDAGRGCLLGGADSRQDGVAVGV